MRSIAALALAFMAICSSGCAARSEQALRVVSHFREALTVSVENPTPVSPGAETPLRFRVLNSGRSPIDACIGLSRNVRILPENDTDGNEPLNISEHVVDRPGCHQRFRLSPGAQFAWSEVTTVSGVVLG